MGLFSRKNTIPEQKPEERSIFDFCGYGNLGFKGMSGYNTSKSMMLSTINAAVNQISNSVALLKMNIMDVRTGEPKIIKHNLTNLLNMKPDPRYNHFNFMKMLIESVILKGQGFAYIERDNKLNVKALHYIDADYVTPIIQEDGSVKYIVQGLKTAIDAINMIHLYMHVDENMNGIPAIKYAILSLEGAMDSEIHSNNFFRSGGNLSGVLKTNGPLDATKREQIRQVWTEAFRNKKDDISVALLPQGVEFQPISVDPATAQLLETRKYSVEELCRFMNISPLKVFQLKEMSYSSLESTQLSYVSDTVMPYVRMLEDELNLKLLKPSEVGNLVVDFDFSSLLTTNKQSEIEYYRGLVTNGLMTPNEARHKLGLPSMENGDSLLVQLSYTTLTNVVNGTLLKGNQDQSQDQNQKIDNKVVAKKDEE